jgi:hypothetical protein
MQPDRYVPNAAAEAAWVIKAFLDALAPRLPDPELARGIRQHLDTECAELAAKYSEWLVDEPARHQLRQSAAVLVAYRRLRGTMPESELLGVLRAAFTEPLRGFIRSGTASMLDRAEDPFTAMVGTSKIRETHAFGASFRFERPRDDNEAYHLNITRCLWHSFFAAEGCPELTTIFCAFDEAWIGAVDPARHGLRFERTTTLGEGGELCPFHFTRVARTAPKPA